MIATKRAFYLAMSTDPALMVLLGQYPPTPGRHPPDVPTSETVAAITYEGETSIARGFKEDQTLTLHVWAFRHDLVENVATELDRIFHPTVAARGQWKPLTITGARAFTRREFAVDVPDRQSPLYHKAIRFRIKLAAAA